MTITLTPELENLVNEEISSGDYDSPNEVLRQGLLLLKDRKARVESLRREVQKGIDAIRNGDYKKYDSSDEMIEKVISEIHAKFEAKKVANKFELAEFADSNLKRI